MKSAPYLYLAKKSKLIISFRSCLTTSSFVTSNWSNYKILYSLLFYFSMIPNLISNCKRQTNLFEINSFSIGNALFLLEFIVRTNLMSTPDGVYYGWYFVKNKLQFYLLTSNGRVDIFIPFWSYNWLILFFIFYKPLSTSCSRINNYYSVSSSAYC